MTGPLPASWDYRINLGNSQHPTLQRDEPHNDLAEEANALARRFKVSSLVALRRIHEVGWIDHDELEAAYEAELDRVLALELRTSRGGDFYRTLAVRVGERFARGVVIDTLEGQTLYRDAVRMLGFRSESAFDRSLSSSEWRSLAYLLDTNVFIEARNRYYGFDLVFGPLYLQIVH